MDAFMHLSRIHTAGPYRLPLSVLRLTCVRTAKDNLTIFPPFDSHHRDAAQSQDKHDSPLDLGFEQHHSDSSAMAGSPFIKTEPNDYGFDPNQFMQYNQGQHQNHFNNSNGAMNINPANLANGNAAMSQSYGQSMSSSFNVGNSGIADDELADLNFEHHHNQPSANFDFNQGMQNFLSQQPMSQQNASVFSHTPDGAPIQSPFENGFNFAQFRGVGQQQFAGGHSMPQQAGNMRPHMQHIDRKISDSRSPATPNTPGLNKLQIGDDFSHPGMQQIHHQRQQGSIGANGWDSTPSGHSWNESSPFPSPANGQQLHHAQISEVLKSSTHHHHKVASSLPTKMEGGGAGPPYQSQEAKRRRRRESHNQVERRRRDNINERIHDLGTLVPQHRLEDEKVRKHLQTNAPLSPSISNASGMSPPNAATSLLAGPHARRAASTGNITTGLPLEEKDKGPNKGDILNGSVAWTRDLMWYMHLKLRQEQELKDLVQQLGHVWPFEQTEEEKRMHTEICEVINKHATMGGFTGYSRAPGTGLRVPGHTNVAGDSTNGEGSINANGFPSTQQALSPGFQSGGSGMSSGQMSHQHQNQFWNGDFKEEDEYGMDAL
ncbi:hypothetical protein LTR36_000902 [Oleoguttula mirabilis]|uniref:BHLH domain-containing protein n=1 Tax=Oleoguttula mirabilis TaxID=1507867 RepID=A0AAV9JNX2_9PEZI|nr:hypothetical protein LTR36_000902 [Oleoguttula mirabilis]